MLSDAANLVLAGTTLPPDLWGGKTTLTLSPKDGGLEETHLWKLSFGLFLHDLVFS